MVPEIHYYADDPGSGPADQAEFRNGLLEVTGLTAEQIGNIALAHHIAIHELTPQKASLEKAGFAVSCLYAAIALVAAALVLEKRDA